MASAEMATQRQLKVERYSPSDIDELMAIELRSFTAPWSKDSYEELAPLESIDIWVARAGAEMVGYMLLQHIGDEMELHTLAAKPEMRRRGVARTLLTHMIGEAKRLGIARIFLQVRPSNAPARSLYDAFGFRPVGLRRRYYKDNDEDALVLKLEIGAQDGGLKA